MKSVITIIMLLSAAASFGIGASKFFARKTAAFKILVTSSFGCFMLGKLYELINLIVGGSINPVFNVGMLGTIGGLLFVFSASYSQMDGLVDDKSEELTKYRLIALLAPIAILGLYTPVLLSGLKTGVKITTLTICIFAALASYYNLKHAIIPDVSFGIIDSIRAYSCLTLILEVLVVLQLLADRLEYPVLWTIMSVLIAVMYPCVLAAMDRGSRKWTI